MTAENGLPDDLFGSPMPQSGHAFWGSDPSGYCACQDCEPTRPIPPDKIEREASEAEEANHAVPPTRTDD